MTGKKKYHFPLLMQYKQAGEDFIVFMERYSECSPLFATGVVIDVLSGSFYIGERNDNWVLQNFSPYQGEVTLSNNQVYLND
jgi:hypothetical protein